MTPIIRFKNRLKRIYVCTHSPLEVFLPGIILGVFITPTNKYGALKEQHRDRLPNALPIRSC